MASNELIYKTFGRFIRKRCFTSIVFFCVSMISLEIHSQVNKYDSLYQILQHDSAHIYRKKIIRPFLNYQERNTINLPPVFNFFGPQVGLYFNDEHIFALCYYFSSPRTKASRITNEFGPELIAANNVQYGTLLYQYIFYKTRYITVSTPLEFGYGKYKTTYSTLEGSYIKTDNRDLFLVNYDLKVTLKPLKWLGVSGSFGYRTANHEILKGIYYAYGIWLGLRPLSNDLRYYLKKRKFRDATRT